MKIDKIVFSASESFSPFWNIQSKIWKTKFNIHPVCLLFADKNKCGLSEEYGDVIEMKYHKSLPDIIQLQFSKFFHPTTEPDTTWITGDIDLIPLQTDYFLSGMEIVPENSYAHLNFSMCGQIWGVDRNLFIQRGSKKTGGYDLPAHYHCAKGSLFKNIFFEDKSFFEVVSAVVDSKQYGMIGCFKNEMNIRGDYWIAEETYTSEKLWNYFRERSFANFYTKDYDRRTKIIEGKYGGNEGSMCPTPTAWNGNSYIYDIEKVKSKHFIEVHCPLPYQSQEKSLFELLTLSGMI